MRTRLKGINTVRKLLADGSAVNYYYLGKGGPRLHGKPGSPEFMASYNEAIASKTPPQRGTLLSILNSYQASEDFRGLANSTRRSYIPLIKRIERAFGDFPLSALVDRRTRGVFMACEMALPAAWAPRPIMLDCPRARPVMGTRPGARRGKSMCKRRAAISWLACRKDMDG
jgi:hypothetical protein